MLVLKLVVDGTYLSLASRQPLVDVASSLASSTPLNHVCVMEMEWFELTLRLCDNSHFAEDYQKVHRRALVKSFSVANIIMCVLLLHIQSPKYLHKKSFMLDQIAEHNQSCVDIFKLCDAMLNSIVYLCCEINLSRLISGVAYKCHGFGYLMSIRSV